MKGTIRNRSKSSRSTNCLLIHPQGRSVQRAALVEKKGPSDAQAKIVKGKEQEVPTPSGDFLVALNRRFAVGDEDFGPSFSSFKSTEQDPDRCPNPDFFETFNRRFGKSKSDSPCNTAPLPGMRHRSQLTFDTNKEWYREYRRVVFDFDYWANTRSTSRFFFGWLNIPKSRILRSVSIPTAVLVAIATASYFTAPAVGAYAQTNEFLQMFPITLSDAPLALTSSIVPLLLVFRTNNAYLRFDEARKMWGLLLNRTRDCVRTAIAFFPRDAVHEKATFARWTIALSIALKCHLRPYDNLRRDLSGLLTEAEEELFHSADHKVNLCLQVMSELIESARIAPIKKLQLMENITTFEDILGGCERLLRTPIPVSYTRQNARVLITALCFFPVLMLPKLGLAVIPATALVSFFLLGIEEIGVEIEDPFGILPLEVISAKSKQDIIALINNQEVTRDVADIIMDYEKGVFERL